MATPSLLVKSLFSNHLRSLEVRTTQPRRYSSDVVAPTPLFITRGSLSMYIIGLSLFAICMLPLDVQSSVAVKKLDIFVSVPPQKFFVEQIGGEYVSVHSLIRPGDSPATYAPPPRQIAALSKAAVYFSIGVPFEITFIEKIRQLLPNLLIVKTQSGIKLRKMISSIHNWKYSGSNRSDPAR